MTANHDVPNCAATDHTMWDYFIVWCPHHQCYTVRSHSYRELGDLEDPLQFTRRELQLGPFDTKADVLEALEQWLDVDWRIALGDPPVLPG